MKKQSYIICATPRSGTTLLCDLLADTGVAGRPDSFFRRQSISWWTNYLGVSTTNWRDEYEFDQEYLATTYQEGAGGTSIFGMRLMWEHVNYLSKRLDVYFPGLSSDCARFQAAFGSICFVHLSREDKAAQAVSRIKAEQTGLWHVDADGAERERLKPEESPFYNAEVLSAQMAEYVRHDAAWVNWFAQQKIQPVNITYEALSRNPQTTLATVLSALGVNPAIAKTVQPRTTRMANSENRRWVARLQMEKSIDKLPT